MNPSPDDQKERTHAHSSAVLVSSPHAVSASTSRSRELISCQKSCYSRPDLKTTKLTKLAATRRRPSACQHPRLFLRRAQRAGVLLLLELLAFVAAKMGRGHVRSETSPSVRMFGANLHYSLIKPRAGSFDRAILILSDGTCGSVGAEAVDGKNGADHVLTGLAATVRRLLFGSVSGPGVDEPVSSSPVVVLDLEPLRREAESKEVAWKSLFEEEGATRGQLGRALGKPVARTLSKLMLESAGAILVARGGLCTLVIKLLRTNDSHGCAAAAKLERVVLLDPDLPKATVNALLTGGPTAASNRISVEVAFSKAALRDRRLPILRAVFPRGCDMLLGPAHKQPSAVNRQNGDDEGATLLPALASLGAKGADVELPDPPFRADEFDGLGRQLYLSAIEVEMRPDTKQYEIKTIDITNDICDLSASARACDDGIDDCTEIGAPAAAEAEELHGAMVLRGNRCILVRSLGTPPLWRGMRLPLLPAAAGERPVDTARRAVAVLCDVDCLDGEDDEFVHLAAVPPVSLHMPTGRGKPSSRVMVHFFYAVNPPPPGPLEDADMEDDEDPYDWWASDE